MMRGFSPKIGLHAVFYVFIALVLGVCVVEPLPLEEFVEKDMAKVKITSDSDPGLKAGDGKITGLDPNKYYMIEEWPQDSESGSDSENVLFVSANGARTSTLTRIGRVKSGAITGLTNLWNYRVKSAQPVSGDTTLHDFTTPPGPPPTAGGVSTEKTIEDGVITLDAPEAEHSYYLDPHPAISNFKISLYSVVKIPISPSGANSPVSPVPNNPNIIALEGEDTETDYIFVLVDDKGNVNTELLKNFYVMKVIVEKAPPEPGTVTLDVTLSYTGDNSPVFNSTSTTYSQTSTAPITINITNAADFGSTIKWYLDDDPVNPIGNGSPFVIDLNNDAVRYRVIGKYTITVIASKDGIPYSAAIEVTVTVTP